jgi:hypothetical protein
MLSAPSEDDFEARPGGTPDLGEAISGPLPAAPQSREDDFEARPGGTPDLGEAISGPLPAAPQSREDDFEAVPAAPPILVKMISRAPPASSLGLAGETHRLYHEAYLPLPPCPLRRYLAPCLPTSCARRVDTLGRLIAPGSRAS